MNTKSTLSLDKDVIVRAKQYAKEKNVSLSFLIENYLQKILADFQGKTATKGSIVEELSGIITLDADYDHKEAHADYLIEKYK